MELGGLWFRRCMAGVLTCSRDLAPDRSKPAFSHTLLLAPHSSYASPWSLDGTQGQPGLWNLEQKESTLAVLAVFSVDAMSAEAGPLEVCALHPSISPGARSLSSLAEERGPLATDVLGPAFGTQTIAPPVLVAPNNALPGPFAGWRRPRDCEVADNIRVVRMEMDHHDVGKEGVGRFSQRWTWWARSPGGAWLSLGGTQHTVYVGLLEPQRPWVQHDQLLRGYHKGHQYPCGLPDATEVPWEEVLDYAMERLQTSGMTTAEVVVVALLAGLDREAGRSVGAKSRLEYSTSTTYAISGRRDLRLAVVTVLDLELLLARLDKGKESAGPNFNCVDAACLTQALAALLGVPMERMELESLGNDFPVEGADPIGRAASLSLRAFDYHQIARALPEPMAAGTSPPPAGDTPVCDLSMSAWGSRKVVPHWISLDGLVAACASAKKWVPHSAGATLPLDLPRIRSKVFSHLALCRSTSLRCKVPCRNWLAVLEGALVEAGFEEFRSIVQALADLEWLPDYTEPRFDAWVPVADGAEVFVFRVHQEGAPSLRVRAWRGDRDNMFERAARQCSQAPKNEEVDDGLTTHTYGPRHVLYRADRDDLPPLVYSFEADDDDVEG